MVDTVQVAIGLPPGSSPGTSPAAVTIAATAPDGDVSHDRLPLPDEVNAWTAAARETRPPLSGEALVGLGHVLVPASLRAWFATKRQASATSVVRLVLTLDGGGLAAVPWEAALIDLGAGPQPLWDLGVSLVRHLPDTAAPTLLRRLPLAGARVIVAGAADDPSLDPFAQLLFDLDGVDHVSDPFSALDVGAPRLAARAATSHGTRAEVLLVVAHGTERGDVRLAGEAVMTPAMLGDVAARVGARMVAVLACDTGVPAGPAPSSLAIDDGLPRLVADLFRRGVGVVVASQIAQNPAAGAEFARELWSDYRNDGLDRRMVSARLRAVAGTTGDPLARVWEAAVPAVWVADPTAGLGVPQRRPGPPVAERPWLTDQIGDWVTRRREVSGSSVLVVSGAPGAGKSSLLRALVEADGVATAGLPVGLDVMRDRNADGWLDQPDTTADVITSWEHRVGLGSRDGSVADRFARLRRELAGDRALVVVVDEWDQLPTDVTDGLQALIEAPHDGAVLWLVGSRHDRPRFASAVDAVEIDITGEDNRHHVDGDLGRYATERLARRPDGADLTSWLVDHADGLFIYVAKLCQRLTDPKVLDDPTDGLHPDRGVDQITAALPETIQEVWDDEIDQARQRADHALGAAGAADLTRILALVLATVDGTPVDVIDDLVGYPTRDAVWRRWVRPLCTRTDDTTAVAVHPTLVDAFHHSKPDDTRHAITQLADWCDDNWCDTPHTTADQWATTHRLDLRTRACRDAPTRSARRHHHGRLTAAAGDLTYLDALCATAGVTAVETALRAATDLTGHQPLESLGTTIAGLHRIVATQASAIGDLGNRPGDLTQQVHLHAALHHGTDHPLTTATARQLEVLTTSHDPDGDNDRPIPRLVVDTTTATIPEPPITLPRRYGDVTAITTLDHPTEGPLLATAHDTGLICTWNATNPYEPRRVVDRGTPSRGTAAAAAGDRVLVGHWDGSVTVVDAADGVVTAMTTATGSPVRCLVVAGDDAVAGYDDGKMTVIDAESGDSAAIDTGTDSDVASMIVVGHHAVARHADSSITVIDLARRTTVAPERRVPSVSCVSSPPHVGGRALAGHWDGNLTLVDVHRGTTTTVTTDNGSSVTCTVAAGNQAVAGHWDGNMTVIDLSSGISTPVNTGSRGHVDSLVAVSDYVVAGHSDGSLTLVDALGGIGTVIETGSESSVKCLVAVGDKVMAGRSDGGITVVDLASDAPIPTGTSAGPSGVTSMIAVGGCGVALHREGSVSITDSASRNAAVSVCTPGYDLPIWQVVAVGDCLLAEMDGSFSVIDVATGATLGTGVRGNPVLSFGDRALVGRSDGDVIMLDVASGTTTTLVTEASSPVRSLVAVGGHALAGHWDGSISVVEPAGRHTTITESDSPVRHLVAVGGHVVAARMDGGFSVLDPRSGVTITTINSGSGGLSSRPALGAARCAESMVAVGHHVVAWLWSSGFAVVDPENGTTETLTPPAPTAGWGTWSPSVTRRSRVITTAAARSFTPPPAPPRRSPPAPTAQFARWPLSSEAH